MLRPTVSAHVHELPPAVAVEARGLRKAYGRRTAVDGLDLTLHQGETLGLLGPNGAGKSTAMQLLSGLLGRDSGQLRVLGGDPRSRAVRRRIGFAPQSLALYPGLTAEENLRFFGRLYGLRGRRLAERTEACLELAALTDRRRDRVSGFSGGMQRRLNLAVAVVHEPELLLLDEPTVGVDPQSRHHLFTCLEQLRARGLTILYSTHYLEEAERLCDRVAIIDRGRILALDSVASLLGAGSVPSVPLAAQPPLGAPAGFGEPHRGGRLEALFLALTGSLPRDSL